MYQGHHPHSVLGIDNAPTTLAPPGQGLLEVVLNLQVENLPSKDYSVHLHQYLELFWNNINLVYH